MRDAFRFAVLLLFFVTGCEKKRSPDITKPNTIDAVVHVIRWEGGVYLTTVVYHFDGLEIGRGKKAYEEVIRRLEQLPNEAHLKVEMPRDIEGLLLDTTKFNDAFPFYSNMDERMRFDKLCGSKNFRVDIDSFLQSEYLHHD